MRKNYFFFFLLFFTVNLFATETWDIIDKSMATWNVNGGLVTNKAWKTSQKGAGISVKQEAGYVNITKTNAVFDNNYAFLIPEALTLSPNVSYTIAIKARLNPTDKTLYPDNTAYFESNQISARLNEKNMAVHLKYGDANSGYLSVSSAMNHSEADKYKLNTSDWHIYRFVFHNSMYDVYVDDVEDPIFENVPTSTMTGSNILRLGAESGHRCNMDIEYAKMGKGAFYSKPKIVSLLLSAGGQGYDQSKTITATAYVVAVDDNEKLTISLVDENDKTIVDAVGATVLANKAEVNLTIPAGLKKGKYYVKVVAPNGKIGETTIIPQKTIYRITTSIYEGKNLATFGNSITAAANSWAPQTAEKLRFGNLYNGAISAAIWYKRERVVAGQTIQTQNYYDDDFAGIITSAPAEGNVLENQKRINNCAIVHLQKYFIELDKKSAPSPDIIVFSYGTNDEVSSMGSAEEALKGNELSEVNIFNMAGALRWSIDTLKIKFPEVKIYVALPLQSTRSGKNGENLKKMEVLKAVCDGLSIPYFDSYNESGITTENSATYLGDGLHPNEAGKEVQAEYIIKKLEEESEKVSSIEQNVVEDGNISISGNIFISGQNISINSSASDSSLSEVTIYNIAGNQILRKSISENESVIQAPSISGIYLMTVTLNNNQSKTFKILIK